MMCSCGVNAVLTSGGSVENYIAHAYREKWDCKFLFALFELVVLH